MRVGATSGRAGILIDRGTGRRIPLARWFDEETGEWEAFAEAPNGAVRCDEQGRPILRRGRAVGRLELVPLGKAKLLPGPPPTPAAEGLASYQRLYFEVWQWRGEAQRCVNGRWIDFLKQNEFLDAFVIRRSRGRL